MQKILIVDDHKSIRDVICFSAEKASYRTVCATNGKEAIDLFSTEKPDLVILDIMMPECDGIEVCRVIRKSSDTPIIFLSSKDEEIDRLLGLEMGGDDYMVKPFSPRELIARCKVVLRRGKALAGIVSASEVSTNSEKIKSFGSLSLNYDRFEARWAGQNLTLTATEFAIIETLMRHPGKVYTRDQLIELAYNGEVTVSDRTIDSHVRRLRRKFSEAGGDPIETVHGFGYKLIK